MKEIAAWHADGQAHFAAGWLNQGVGMSLAKATEAELLALRPDFGPWWEAERWLWTHEDGSFTTHGVFAAFSHFIAAILSQGPAPELQEVFEYVESKLDEEGSEVSDAAATCFLENLLNRVPELIGPDALVPLLGPKSRAFCRAWDKWCGVRTEGLHPPEENGKFGTGRETSC